jgi:RTA1 like protein
MTCDFISLLLQAAGGALASGAKSATRSQTGINIMIAGLSFQVFSLTLFMALCAEFAWRVMHNSSTMNDKFRELRESTHFKAFLVGEFVSAMLFVRIC